jgi:hypothetical protein
MGQGDHDSRLSRANIEGAIYPERREHVNGNWNELPKTVLEVKARPPMKSLPAIHDVEKMVGKNEMKNIPYGAIGFYTLADKLACGVQQLMAGAENSP